MAAPLTIGLMVGIAANITLVTLTRSMSSDVERKMESLVRKPEAVVERTEK